MPYTIQDVRNIILRPHAGHRSSTNSPLIFSAWRDWCTAAWKRAAWRYGDGHCLVSVPRASRYRFISPAPDMLPGRQRTACLRAGTFLPQGGLHGTSPYRGDLQEHQSLLQQLCGLKTVVILSTNWNSPKLDLIGIRRGNDIVAIIRERVEINKRKKGIYEIKSLAGGLLCLPACFRNWPRRRLPLL